MKQLGTINVWPKNNFTLLISNRDQTFCAAIILLFYTVINLCSRPKKLYRGRKGNMRVRARANHDFNRCCFLSIIFIHFISNSWQDIQISRMYKISEYYCSNHTILSWVTNQKSVNTQNSVTCNKHKCLLIQRFESMIQAKILTNGDYFMTKRKKLSKYMHKKNSWQLLVYFLGQQLWH